MFESFLRANKYSDGSLMMKTNRIMTAAVVFIAIVQVYMLVQQHRSSQIITRPPVVSDAPKGSSMDLKGLQAQGSQDAKVVLVEFSDYECPFCARHSTSVAKELNK